MDSLDRFEFSQSSLQDYLDCRQRFRLRYIERIAWPAAQAEPIRENEQNIQRGERFHRLAQQYLVGVPEEKLSRMAEADEDPHLRAWWANFLDCIPASLDGQRHVEVILSAPFSRFRLVAKYDLVLVRPDGNVILYDWKTSLHRPKKTWLAARMQTRIYPYLLALAGAALNNGRSIEPGQIEMIYWYTGPQQPPEVFRYSLLGCQEDEIYLHELINEIATQPPEGFRMTHEIKTCTYCVYRSLCNRGIRAGLVADHSNGIDEEAPPPEYQNDADGALDFGLEQIGEVAF